MIAPPFPLVNHTIPRSEASAIFNSDLHHIMRIQVHVFKNLATSFLNQKMHGTSVTERRKVIGNFLLITCIKHYCAPDSYPLLVLLSKVTGCSSSLHLLQKLDTIIYQYLKFFKQFIDHCRFHIGDLLWTGCA